MKHLLLWLTAVALAPLLPGEELHYAINWSSGLSLGEATLSGEKGTENWKLEFKVEASFAGFTVRDNYKATSDLDFCSSKLEKTTQRGARKSQERETFDQKTHTVTREAVAGDLTGGASQFEIPPCAHDALTLLQFARHELAEGKLPAQQPVVLGSLYQVRMQFAGVQTVTIAEQPIEADRVRTSIKGPASDITVEILFAHDDVRTPLEVKIPSPLGVFTLELIR